MLLTEILLRDRQKLLRTKSVPKRRHEKLCVLWRDLLQAGRLYLHCRAAKLLEVKDPARAVSLYQKAADTVGTEDRSTEAGQHLEQAAKLCVRTGQHDRAAELLEAALGTYSEGPSPTVGSPYGRVVLAFILIQEKRGDCVAASKVSSE